MSEVDAMKTRLKQLMEMREAMEKEIEERVHRLEAPGGAGRTGNLVDAEGFPRSDIDVHAARLDRNRVIVLTNDHKAISDQIQEALVQLHEAARKAKEAEGSTTQDRDNPSTSEGPCPEPES